MATKTFEELKQLAIQIRDEKTNKQNTATRIGTQMLEHLDKLEQDYYDKTATDEELKERDEKLTELEEKNKFGFLLCQAEPNSARGEIAYEGTFETGLYKKDYSFDTAIPWIKTTTVITTDSSLDNYFIKANFASINEGFYNLVILNEDETIKFGLIITGRKVVRLPKIQNLEFR